MGCCCSQEDDDSHIQEPTERTGLLANTPANVAESRSVLPTPSTRPTGSETLAQILDRSANAYIDINAVDSSRIRSHSLSSKTMYYSDRMNSSASVQSSVKNPQSLPFGVPSHNAVLSEPIISKTDIDMVTTTSETLSADLENMKPRVKEPLATYLPS